jgi:hypothetical protein
VGDISHYSVGRTTTEQLAHPLARLGETRAAKRRAKWKDAVNS